MRSPEKIEHGGIPPKSSGEEFQQLKEEKRNKNEKRIEKRRAVQQEEVQQLKEEKRNKNEKRIEKRQAVQQEEVQQPKRRKKKQNREDDQKKTNCVAGSWKQTPQIPEMLEIDA